MRANAGPTNPSRPTIAGTVPSQNAIITDAPSAALPVPPAVTTNAHSQPHGKRPVSVPISHARRRGGLLRIRTSALPNVDEPVFGAMLLRRTSKYTPQPITNTPARSVA